MKSLVQKWNLKKQKEMPGGRIFEYETRDYESQVSDKKGSFDILHFYDWVNIIAIDKCGKLVFVRQFRAATDSLSLEIPGGAIERGEEPIIAAKRELKEETGYTSSSWKELGVVHPNPGFMTNRCWSYLAENCELTDEQELDPMEEISVELYNYVDVKNKMLNGEITHSLVIAAFQFLELKRDELKINL